MKNTGLLRIILSVIYAGFVFLSCIDTFRPELAKSDLESQLVVEGTITDESGPFRVRLILPVDGSILPYVFCHTFFMGQLLMAMLTWGRMYGVQIISVPIAGSVELQ